MNRNKFSFRSFFSLINQLHPQYIKFFVGILLGFISAGANLFVPQLAQKLINNFKSISPTLAILTVVIFIAGLITSALSGLLLGIFGENIVSKLRKQLWQKLLKMPVKYFDDVKKTVLFYLENGNQKRIGLLKRLAEKQLIGIGKAWKYDKYEKFWKEIEGRF